MNLIEKIIQFRQNRVLRLLTNTKRTKRIENLEKIKTIGIVFEVGNDKEWNTLYSFTRSLENAQKKVWLIGFQRDKQEINYIFTHPRTIICHEKEDFNFFKLPKEGIIEGFTNQPFNLLIDCTKEPDFFGQYVAAKSTADLKVTYINDSENSLGEAEKVFDFHIHGKKPIDLPLYLTNVQTYLGMIRK